jgi:S1-C subfamily serine protease
MVLMQGGSKDRADGDGRFTIEHLPPGPVSVEFIDLDDFEVQAELRIADLGAGEVRDVGEIPALVLQDVPDEERGWVGLETRATAPPGQPAVLRVTAVDEGTPAALAGVLAGDIVLRIDDVEVATLGPNAARRLVANKHLRPGDVRRVLVRRADGSEQTLSLRAVKPKPKP